MGRSVAVLNHYRRRHRGRATDPRANKRAHFRRSGTGSAIAIDPAKQTQHWWTNFQVSTLLRKWRLGE